MWIELRASGNHYTPAPLSTYMRPADHEPVGIPTPPPPPPTQEQIDTRADKPSLLYRSSHNKHDLLPARNKQSTSMDPNQPSTLNPKC